MNTNLTGVLTLLALTVPSLCHAEGADKTGNGGNGYKLEFTAAAQEGLAVLKRLAQTSPKAKDRLGLLAKIIEPKIGAALPIYSARSVTLNGAEVTAINYRRGISKIDANYPSVASIKNYDVLNKPFIIIGERLWKETQHETRVMLAIHEYAVLAGYEDLYHEISGILLNGLGADSGQASNDELENKMKLPPNVALRFLGSDLDKCLNSCDSTYGNANHVLGDMFGLNTEPVQRCTQANDGKVSCEIPSWPAWHNYEQFILEIAQFRQCYSICEMGDPNIPLDSKIKRAKEQFPENVFESRYLKSKDAQFDSQQSVFKGSDYLPEVRCKDMPAINLDRTIQHGVAYKKGSSQWVQLSNLLYTGFCKAKGDEHFGFGKYAFDDGKAYWTNAGQPIFLMTAFESGLWAWDQSEYKAHLKIASILMASPTELHVFGYWTFQPLKKDTVRHVDEATHLIFLFNADDGRLAQAAEVSLDTETGRVEDFVFGKRDQYNVYLFMNLSSKDAVAEVQRQLPQFKRLHKRWIGKLQSPGPGRSGN